MTTLPIAHDNDSKRDGRRLAEITLTKDEWKLLDELYEVLVIFDEATTYLGASKYVTYSVMSPIIKEIKKRVKPQNIRQRDNVNIDIEEIIDVFEEEEEGEQAEYEANSQNMSRGKLNLNQPLVTTKMLEKVKLNLYNAMELYFDKEEGEVLISALLDPRIKSLTFVDDNRVRDEAKELLKNKYNELKDNPSSTTCRTLPTQFNQPSLFSIFEQHSSHDDELTVYLSLPEINFHSDPFTWWRDHRDRFPILSRLARIYLPISATSTPSERLFSTAGNLLTAKRTCLTLNCLIDLCF